MKYQMKTSIPFNLLDIRLIQSIFWMNVIALFGDIENLTTGFFSIFKFLYTQMHLCSIAGSQATGTGHNPLIRNERSTTIVSNRSLEHIIRLMAFFTQRIFCAISTTSKVSGDLLKYILRNVIKQNLPAH